MKLSTYVVTKYLTTQFGQPLMRKSISCSPSAVLINWGLFTSRAQIIKYYLVYYFFKAVIKVYFIINFKAFIESLKNLIFNDFSSWIWDVFALPRPNYLPNAFKFTWRSNSIKLSVLGTSGFMEHASGNWNDISVSPKLPSETEAKTERSPGRYTVSIQWGRFLGSTRFPLGFNANLYE